MGKNEDAIEIACVIKKPSVGKTTRSLGIEIPNKNLTLSKAKDLFVDKRLNITLAGRIEGEGANQAKLFDTGEPTIDLVVDSRSFTVFEDRYSLSLSMKRSQVAAADLEGFAFAPGAIRVNKVEGVAGHGDDKSKVGEEDPDQTSLADL